MKIDISLYNSALFRDITPEESDKMLACLSAVRRSASKGDFIFRQGDTVHTIGLVLTGAVHIIKEDFWGDRTIIGKASPGEVFGEAYACSEKHILEVSVLAVEPASILFLDIRHVLNICTSACGFHTRLIKNLMLVMAQKNLMLTQKADHMSKKTTRDKLLSYLSSQSAHADSTDFSIPFNRQQLAEYLAVDRSAMSNELSKLQREGYLRYHKNQFHLEPLE